MMPQEVMRMKEKKKKKNTEFKFVFMKPENPTKTGKEVVDELVESAIKKAMADWYSVSK